MQDCLVCTVGNIDVRMVPRTVILAHLSWALFSVTYDRVNNAPADAVPVCASCRQKYMNVPDELNDPVSHPAHYTFGKLEVIEVIEDWGWGLPFCLGNTIKYVARAGRKDPTKLKQDLEKARWYLDRAIEIVTKGG